MIKKTKEIKLIKIIIIDFFNLKEKIIYLISKLFLI